jgi:hypothetical protein
MGGIPSGIGGACGDADEYSSLPSDARLVLLPCLSPTL